MTVRARYLDPKKGARTEANARELSLGGMFIETQAPLDEGALLTIDIEAAGEKVTVDARVLVVRKKGEGDKPAGMGVRFLDLPPDVAAALMKVVSASGGRDKTILGVGGPPKVSTKPGVAPPVPLPAGGKTEKTTLGIGVPPEALDKAVPKPPLPTRATAPSNPFDANWEAPPEPPPAAAKKDDKAFDKTMDISSSEILDAGEPTPAPLKPKGWSEKGAAKLEESTPEGWKWDEGQKEAEPEPEPVVAKPPPKKEPPPKKKREERESSIPPPPKGGGGWLFWLVVLGAAAGAGYYYRDEVMKLVNPPPAPTASTPAPPPLPAVTPDATVADAETAADAATTDASSKDAGTDAAAKDAGAHDAGAKDAGPKDAGKHDAAAPKKP